MKVLCPPILYKMKEAKLFLGAQSEWLVKSPYTAQCVFSADCSGPSVVIQRQFAQTWLKLVKKK